MVAERRFVMVPHDMDLLIRILGGSFHQDPKVFDDVCPYIHFSTVSST